MEKKYHRILRDKKPPGHVIKRCGPPALENDYPEVEAILEERRPVTCISRSESVNMRDDLDFSLMGIKEFDEGYVHTVKPVGTVESRDVAWIGELQARFPKNCMRLPKKYPDLDDKEIADRYWRGEESAHPSFEYVSKEAVVVSAEDKLTPVRPRKAPINNEIKKAVEYDKDRPDR